MNLISLVLLGSQNRSRRNAVSVRLFIKLIFHEIQAEQR